MLSRFIANHPHVLKVLQTLHLLRLPPDKVERYLQKKRADAERIKQARQEDKRVRHSVPST